MAVVRVGEAGQDEARGRTRLVYRVLLAAIIKGLESDLCSGGQRCVVCSCSESLGERMKATSEFRARRRTALLAGVSL